jgi:hypothetical protein
MDLRTLSLTEKIALANKLLSVAEGDEFLLNGEVWFRIDQREFKVTPVGSMDEDDCAWVPATTMDIIQSF